MSAETFTTALFLITAVVASGVLINAVFPVVYNMAGTFSSATHESDERLRTDYKIVTEFGKDGIAEIWMKNVGSAKISSSDIIKSDVFCGAEDNFGRVNYNKNNPMTGNYWFTEFATGADVAEYDLNGNNYWDPGETLHIIVYSDKLPLSDNTAYFQFILPDGIWRSITFNMR